jgi:hypothetical protein
MYILIDLNKCEYIEGHRFYVYAYFISGAVVRILIKFSVVRNYF